MARLVPGASVAAWHLGAVRFFTATSGVGITAGRFPCFRRIRGGEQQEIGFQSEPVRLASTSDGGRSWRIIGRTLPFRQVPGGATGAQEIAATSPADVWALVRGRLVATSDGGSDWRMQAIPDHVIQLATSGGAVWALACTHVASRTSPSACRPKLWRTGSPNSVWTPVGLPPTTAEGPYVRFAAAARDIIITLVQASSGAADEVLVSRNAGGRWSRRPAPTWDHQKCGIPAAVSATPPRTFWLLCLGGAAAGSSAKALLRTTDEGRTWTTVSAVASLTGPERPGSLPLEEPSALAAGSRSRLWLSLTNGLAESNDGGRRWASVPQAWDPSGWETVIDAGNANHAWVLAPGAGLWRTTDGLDWHAIPPLNDG